VNDTAPSLTMQPLSTAQAGVGEVTPSEEQRTVLPPTGMYPSLHVKVHQCAEAPEALVNSNSPFGMAGGRQSN